MSRLASAALPRALLGLGLLLLTACPDEEKKCLDDRTCGVGNRCERDGSGPGVCVVCDAAEVPYDGEDNDCNNKTRDQDLDDDGENAQTAAIAPGPDCDDQDPTINSRAREVCGDAKDNDCDQKVDEPDCADMRPPTVVFVSPEENATLSGTFTVQLEVDDDVMVQRVELIAGLVRQSRAGEGLISIEVNSTMLPDGPVTLRVEVTDIANKRASAERQIRVENNVPPRIGVISPRPAESHRGRLRMEAVATDLNGVEEVAIYFDGRLVATSTVEPYAAELDTDTSSVPEGIHTVRFLATDRAGSQAEEEVGVLVDRTGPRPTIEVNPRLGLEVRGAFQVTVTASDAAGLASLTSSTATITRQSPTSPLIYTVNTLSVPRLPNGPLTIYARARDNTIIDGVPLGNQGAGQVTVVVNNTPPEPLITLTDPRNGDGVFRRYPLRALVSSPTGAQILRVQFRVNNGPPLEDTMAPYEVVYDFSALAGTATVSARAEDSSGYSAVDTVSVRIVDPPRLRFALRSAPAEMATLGAAGYAVGDVTGDGYLDVVAGGSALMLFPNTLTLGRRVLGQARTIAQVGTVDVRLAQLDVNPEPDLVSLTGTELELRTNLGNGVFSAPVSRAHGVTGPLAFDVGDLDGDGDVDAVVGINSGGDIRVFKTSGGVFDNGTSYGQVGTVSDVRLARMDGDADLDVVVGRSGSSVVTVYLNDGSGNFGAGINSFTAGAPRTVAVGDVNGDGNPDIVCALTAANAVQVMLGSSTPGVFTAQPSLAGQGPTGVALGYLQGSQDTTLDLVRTYGPWNAMEVALNAGGGAFGPSAHYLHALDAHHPSLADVDGDGFLDVLAVSGVENRLVVVPGRGALSFAAPETADVTRPRTGIAAADFDGDGRTDVVVMSPQIQAGAATIPAEVAVVENDAAGWALRPGTTLPFNTPTSLAAGDLDGVGEPDVAVGSTNRQVGMPVASAALVLGPASTPQVTSLYLESPRAVAIGDVDNDGAGEAVFTQDFMAGSDGSVVVESTGVTSALINEGTGATSVAVGSLDGYANTTLDYAVANAQTNDITVNYWRGLAFQSITYSAQTSVSAVTIGLVGNDQLYDLVGLNSTGEVIVMQGSQALGFTAPVRYAGGPNPTALVGGDLNADGLYDVLTLSPGTDGVALLLARPQGGFFDPLVLPVVDAPSGFVAGDFDQDGQLDVALTSSSYPRLSLIFNDLDRF